MTAAVPVGIVTHNRAVYLDATLRSLTATLLPGVPVTIFDDASDCPLARRFLDTSDEIPATHRWPKHPAWEQAGLGELRDCQTLRGVAGRVEVVRVAGTSVGAVNASRFALRTLFARHPDAPAVVLLQDDVVFAADWMPQLLTELVLGQMHRPKLALVAGMHLDAVDLFTRGIKIEHTAPYRVISGQCYLVLRTFFDAHRAWFDEVDHERKNFDRRLCDLANESGWETRLIVPYVCQHIGVQSEVRPETPFEKQKRIRIGYSANPPWVLG